MKDIINKEIEQWKRPWNLERFDDLYNRDERFFSILLKGALNWLTQNIVLYNQPILHFIFNTGSSYMYVESNGYEFSWNDELISMKHFADVLTTSVGAFSRLLDTQVKGVPVLVYNPSGFEHAGFVEISYEGLPENALVYGPDGKRV